MDSLKINSKKSRAFLYIFPALLFLQINICTAQEREKEDSLTYEIQGVVITGTRTVERIIDIPYSVFRVDKKELSYGKKVSAKDVLADVPGLFLQSRYGNHDLRISIRGFGTRSNSGVRGVRILQDGIPESEPDGETVIDAVDFTSLGSVEVVKGNLSSLYANAPGGVINFVSDLYFLENYFSLNNQTGKNGLRQNGFKLGLANDENRLFLSYNYRNLDGYREHSNEYQHLINTVYEAYLGGKTSLTVLGNFVNGLNKLPGSLTKSEFEADPFQAYPLAVSQDFKRITKKGRLAVRFKTKFGESGNHEIEITGYGGIKELEKTDDELYRFSTRYSLGSFLRYSGKFEILNRQDVLTLGMDYAGQSGPITDFENINGNKGISVQNEYNESLGDVGFYLLNRFAIVPDRLDLLLSSRFDRNIFTRDIFIPYGYTDTIRTFQKLTPKVGLNYKFVPSVALYTSYGLSYDYPALSELANTPLSSNIRYSINPDIDPQNSNNFEIGIKGNILNPESEFSRKLFFDVTFFHYVINKEIIPYIIGQKTYFRNAGKTTRTGLEAGIKSEPFEGIELVTNYIFTRFRYAEYVANVYDPSGVTVKNYEGNTVPSVPAHILNLILNYEFEISASTSGLLQWDCDYIARMFVNDENSESVPGYFYGNVLAGINFSSGFLSLTAYAGVNNIFDRRYAGFININDYLGRYYETGEPRNIYAGFKLSCKY